MAIRIHLDAAGKRVTEQTALRFGEKVNKFIGRIKYGKQVGHVNNHHEACYAKTNRKTGDTEYTLFDLSSRRVVSEKEIGPMTKLDGYDNLYKRYTSYLGLKKYEEPRFALKENYIYEPRKRAQVSSWGVYEKIDGKYRPMQVQHQETLMSGTVDTAKPIVDKSHNVAYQYLDNATIKKSYPFSTELLFSGEPKYAELRAISEKGMQNQAVSSGFGHQMSKKSAIGVRTYAFWGHIILISNKK